MVLPLNGCSLNLKIDLICWKLEIINHWMSNCEKKCEQGELCGSVNWDVGAHTGFCKNIYGTIQRSLFRGMYTTQFFMGNPRSFKRHLATQEDIKRSVDLVKRFPMHVFSHFPYIANLAGSVKQLAWDGDRQQDWKTQNVISSLEYELNVLSNFNIRTNGVVIHPGNYKDRKIGISTIAKSINKIHFTEGSKLLLENAAGKGCSLATTFREIRDIIDQVDESKKRFLGVCVDTAHICGYGEYDLSNCEEVDRMFREFDEILGMDRFSLLHLNDSLVPLGSRKDHHACLGTGQIWGQSFDSLVHLLDKCKEYDIPAVLETHNLDMCVLAALSV